MPWAPPIFPSLGAATLRTMLIREEVACDILYGNLVFSKVLRGDPFLEQQFFKFAFSEIAFTPYYFEMLTSEAASRLRDHAAALTTDKSMLTLDRYEEVVARAGECLDSIAETTEWENYDIVGFSVMMQQ